MVRFGQASSPCFCVHSYRLASHMGAAKPLPFKTLCERVVLDLCLFPFSYSPTHPKKREQYGSSPTLSSSDVMRSEAAGMYFWSSLLNGDRRLVGKWCKLLQKIGGPWN